jgi:hypothetical protein
MPAGVSPAANITVWFSRVSRKMIGAMRQSWPMLLLFGGCGG